MPTEKLYIPETHREALASLIDLDDLATQALLRALDRTSAAAPSEFASHADVPNTEPAKLAKMFSALRMLYTVRAREYQELPAFVESLMAGMRNTADSRLAVTDNNRETVKTKLTKLLSANAFAIISKVEDLGSEGQRILYGSRVLTDLRPVFREAPSDAPVGLIVVHTIKLEYHTFDYKHEDIYIVASESELRDMQDAITRALKKSETLQATFRDTGIAFLDSGTKQ